MPSRSSSRPRNALTPSRAASSEASPVISVTGARQHNLKNIDVEVPLGKMTVVTGPSGSGKSSLAFDTIYAEGQRRYTETFSPYTRQFLDRMDKPRVDRVEGIPPAVALGQANSIRTSRSTVGTLTEVADYLKLLMARKARLFSPASGREVKPWKPEELATHLMNEWKGQRILIGTTLSFDPTTSRESVVATLEARGIIRCWHEGALRRLDEIAQLPSVIEAVTARLNVDITERARLVESIGEAFKVGRGLLWIQSSEQGTTRIPFASTWTCPESGQSFTPPTPALFSFNNPLGACPHCRGFGRTVEIDYERALPDRNLSIADGVIKPFQTESNAPCQQDLERACKRKKIPLQTPFHQLSAAQQRFVIEGEPGEGYENRWYGVKGFFDWLESKTYKVHVRVLLARYRTYRTCPECQGDRFQPELTHWKMDGRSLPEINRLALRDLEPYLAKLEAADRSEETLLDQCRSRVGYLNRVGLGYLTLNRSARTLSGGEIQRVNLTTCLGSALVGTLFVLDEPSIGLHPRDTAALIETLRDLTDRGNTTLIVEHDEQFMRCADHLLELGPDRGDRGGELVFSGTPREMIGKNQTLTAHYLSGKRVLPIPTKPRTIPAGHPHLEFLDASKHNLSHVDVRIPLGRFTAITGVSGSGKSTLLRDVIHKHLEKHLNHPVEEPAELKSLSGAESLREVHWVDQSPLTKTPRSTPMVYLGCYDALRNLYARTESALSRGLKASSFSFNSGDGRCPRCQGTGYEKITMQFLSDVYVLCPVCEGRRFQKHVLEVTWKGKGIDAVLELSIDEALVHFSPEQEELSAADRKDCTLITSALSMLQEVGLGYLRLGQPLTQLSGGESQRVKLVQHLTRAQHSFQSNTKPTRNREDVVLILDEPTTGLHPDDVAILIRVLQRIVDAGVTLCVIEHHLELIRCADHVIEMGPEAGDEGGRILFSGTPAELSRHPTSHTATYLNKRGGRSNSPARPKKSALTASPHIEVIGARHHNLKNLHLTIPRNQMVVLTGLSGSGKSTLAFDLLFSEGQRRYLDCLNSYARQFMEQLEKPEVDAILGLPPTVAIEQRTTRGGAKSTVATVTEIYHFLRLLYSKLGVQHDPDTGEAAVRQSPDEIVQRLRQELKRGDLALLAPLVRNRKGIYTEIARWAERKGHAFLRVNGKWIAPSEFKPLDRYREHNIDVILGTLEKGNRKLEALVAHALELGKGTLTTVDNASRETLYSLELYCPGSRRSFEPLDPRLFSYNSPYGWCATCQGYGSTARVSIDPRLEGAEREIAIEAAREESVENVTCPDCHGTRLNPVARAVHFFNQPVTEWNRLPVKDFAREFGRLKFVGRDMEIARDIIPEITQRLQFLDHVGLGYLQLDRSAPTLSGGESQRIRLAAQLGSNLQGVLYILDEPTIGLHPRDNHRLLDLITALKDRGNSIVMVEHDEDTMRRADQIIDLGPGAGIHGGQIVAQGHWKELTSGLGKPGSQKPSSRNARLMESSTARILGEPMIHPLRGERRGVNDKTPCLRIEGASIHNLKQLDVSIPRGRLVALSGVSGSGKSTLMHGVIRPAAEAGRTKPRKSKSSAEVSWKRVHGAEGFRQIMEIDQSPIGKTSRSTVATYIGLMDHLRALFASSPVAKARGFSASHFSYNSGQGRCPSCQGQGFTLVEMNFLPSTLVPCGVCMGKRWTDSVLEVTYRDHSIHQVMEMSVDEATDFFAGQPKLTVPLTLMRETGLGYLKLGQTSPTLSGGEAQRLKLVSELALAEWTRQKMFLKTASRDTAENLYLLEEPTVGLHLSDVKKLIDLMHRLVDAGHSVIVIEHHVNVLAEADWVIDIGPEGGDGGGTLVAAGTPEQVARHPKSHTAPFLRSILGTISG